MLELSGLSMIEEWLRKGFGGGDVLAFVRNPGWLLCTLPRYVVFVLRV